MELQIAEAAVRLGVSVDALRMRWRRGKIPGRRDGDGRVWIEVGEQSPKPPEPPKEQAEQSTQAERELIDALKGEVTDLRHRLDQADQAQNELRRLLLSAQQQALDMVRKIPELSAPADSKPEPLPSGKRWWPWRK